jgi:hypothetical protein
VPSLLGYEGEFPHDRRANHDLRKLDGHQHEGASLLRVLLSPRIPLTIPKYQSIDTAALVTAIMLTPLTSPQRAIDAGR